jgi:hypothetical protein
MKTTLQNIDKITEDKGTASDIFEMVNKSS